MQIITRQITAQDALAITNLSAQLGYPLSEEQIHQNIQTILAHNDLNAFVATDDNKVVGWIGVAQVFMIESLPYCEINGLVIDENYRGKGIGKLLIERARQWAKKNGNDKLRLRCNVKRLEAHKFYQHLGFKAIKQQTNFEIDI
jgi:GNAT superfamily N-acetyltransferase